MHGQAPIYKRRNYFIKKDFQLRFILKFCAIVLVGGALSASLLLLLNRDTLTSSFTDSRLTIQNTWTAILPDVLMTGIITLILITLAAIAVTLFVSHKIGGPLFRLEQEVREIGEGNLARKVRFREKDQITPLAEGVNRMAENLNKKVYGIQTGLEHLIESARDRNAPRELIDALNNLQQEIQDNFTIEGGPTES